MSTRYVRAKYNTSSQVSGYSLVATNTGSIYLSCNSSEGRCAYYYTAPTVNSYGGITSSSTYDGTITQNNSGAARSFTQTAYVANSADGNWYLIEWDTSAYKYALVYGYTSNLKLGVSNTFLGSQADLNWQKLSTQPTYTTVQGSTFYGNVYSDSASAYPTNGESGGYWYVYQGVEHTAFAGVDGTVKTITPTACVGGTVKTNVSTYLGVNGVVKQG